MAMDKLDLLVVIDPYPSATAAMAAMPKDPNAKYEVNPNRDVYLLPATTAFENYGSVTASNRSLQWREKVIEPLFESRSDQAIMYAFAQRLGFVDQLLGKKDGRQNVRLVKVKDYEEPDLEDVLRNEINRGCWTIGYTGQTPERLQAHMRNMHLFDVKTLRAPGGKDAVTGYDLTGDYFGLPWPCFGTPELKHPGTPNLYDTSKNVMEGGGNFRANFGVERDGVACSPPTVRRRRAPTSSSATPSSTTCSLKKLGWWEELTEAEQKEAEGKNWKTDLSGGIIRVVMKNHGCMPYGNARRGRSCGTSPMPFRSTASRCIRRGRTSSRNTRPTTTSRRSGAYRRCTVRSSRRTWRTGSASGIR